MVAPYWMPPSKVPSAAKESSEVSLDIFYANLNSQNRDKSLLIDHLSKVKPDIVMLIEVTESWMKKLSSLSEVYPYSKAIVKNDNFGMAILSKTPLAVDKVFVDRQNLIPALFLHSEFSTSSLNLVLLHPHPPIGSYGTLMRDHYLSVLARQIHDLKSPLLVCGDFNTTPWTATFREFIEKSKLRLANNEGIVRTWPAGFPLALPIDHCLTRNLKTMSYKIGPDIGSDHFPLIVRALFKPTLPDRSVSSEL